MLGTAIPNPLKRPRGPSAFRIFRYTSPMEVNYLVSCVVPTSAMSLTCIVYKGYVKTSDTVPANPPVMMFDNML